MNLHFRRRIAALHFAGQRRDSLNFGEGSAAGVVGERRDIAQNLIDDIRISACRMERKMARTGTRLDGRRRRIVRHERAFGWIELVNQNLVEAEIGSGGETVRGVEIDRVRVRLFLARRIHARPGVLDERAGLGELAVAAHGQRGDAAAAVVGDEHVFAGLVHDQMARAVAAR